MMSCGPPLGTPLDEPQQPRHGGHNTEWHGRSRAKRLQKSFFKWLSKIFNRPGGRGGKTFCSCHCAIVQATCLLSVRKRLIFQQDFIIKHSDGETENILTFVGLVFGVVGKSTDRSKRECFSLLLKQARHRKPKAESCSTSNVIVLYLT